MTINPPHVARDRAKVKSFVQGPKVISREICLGCMRPKFWSNKPFCDRFCEELYRKDQERKKKQSLPSEPSRSSFFVEGAIFDSRFSAAILNPEKELERWPTLMTCR